MTNDFVIITSSDSKFGDFFLSHWFKSLSKNVNLDKIDVVVLDYGLTKNQIKGIKETNKVKIIKCKRNGAIVVIRFRDILEFIKKNKYEQIMVCDGGDIIFQKDISGLFRKNIKDFQAVCEEYKVPYEDVAIFQESINTKIIPDIKKYIKDKKMINAGVLIAPRNKIIKLCQACNEYIVDKTKFGSDQVIVNYILYKEGFIHLESGYNFIIYTVKTPFSVKKGKFYDKSNNLIPIIHNSGRYSFIRAINNFGYGEEYNKIKFFRYYLFRFLIKLLNKMYY